MSLTNISDILTRRLIIWTKFSDFDSWWIKILSKANNWNQSTFL